MQQFRAGGFSILPPVIKNLLILNVIFFLAQLGIEQAFRIDIVKYLGLHYVGASGFNPIQIITYLFLHGSFPHLFFNMFALWMFGAHLENIWGAKKFIIFYLIAGIGAGITNEVVNYFQIHEIDRAIDSLIADPSIANYNRIGAKGYLNYGPSEYTLDHLATIYNKSQKTQALINYLSELKHVFPNRYITIGASGSVFGLLMAFGMMFPNNVIYLYFAFPIKAKWFVLGYGIIELFSGFYESNSNIAHFAHVGGMFFAFFVLWHWKRKGQLYSN